ncbi:MAG: radical SAM protein [Candidatus Bathyarchaeia archaeon]|nr:radical SAM protein [Candidatus Bathyarchaeota archaeon]
MKRLMIPYIRMLARYMELKLKAWKPLAAFYNVTLRCNLRCSFCSVWRQSACREANYEEATRIVKNVGDAGIPSLGFSGGEPLLRLDIVKLAYEAKNYGMLTSINTNGTLVNEGNAQKLSKVFDYIIISIDDIGILHDKVRGVDGAYDKALKAITILKRHGATVGVNTVVTRDNIWRIIELWNNISDKVDFLTIQPVNPPQIIDAKLAYRLAEELHEFKKRTDTPVPLPKSYIDGMVSYMSGNIHKVCDAGRLYISIQPDGAVIPCSTRDDVILGNLIKERLEMIIDRERSMIMRIAEHCDGCWLTCTTGISLTFREPTEIIRSYWRMKSKIRTTTF